MPKFDIDSEFVRKLAALLQETGLTDIEVSEGEKSIRISRAGGQPTVVSAMAAPVTVAAPSATPATAQASGASSPGTITSPMVGTAYLAPEPGAAPFVKVGDTVKAGQTVVIVEAMKVMNPIKAPKAGIVTKVFVSDAQPVEFGEPLLAIE